jgi:uncharacterized protein (TIGR02246 family)
MQIRMTPALLSACCGAFIATSASLANGGAPGPQPAAVCALATPEEIGDLYDLWNATIATAHPDKMTRLYAPDAMLMPSNSAMPRQGYAAIRDYFVHTLQSRPRAEVESRTVRVGCDMAIDTGVQTVSTIGKGTPGTDVNERQRYTLVYVRHNDHWLIENHHTSKLVDADDASKATKPRRQPAVAGYVRRIPESTPIQRLQSPAPSAPAVTSGYKPGFWINDVPNFE